jgi:hypothetical protein
MPRWFNELIALLIFLGMLGVIVWWTETQIGYWH